MTDELAQLADVAVQLRFYEAAEYLHGIVRRAKAGPHLPEDDDV